MATDKRFLPVVQELVSAGAIVDYADTVRPHARSGVLQAPALRFVSAHGVVVPLQGAAALLCRVCGVGASWACVPHTNTLPPPLPRPPPQFEYQTALHRACIHGFTEIAEFLLNSGANIERRDRVRCCARRSAAHWRTRFIDTAPPRPPPQHTLSHTLHQTVCGCRLRARMCIFFRAPVAEVPTLHLLGSANRWPPRPQPLPCITLAFRPRPPAQTYTTPLLHACMNNQLTLANVLIKRGAQWAVKSTQGLTPLDLAMMHSKGGMIKLLNVRGHVPCAHAGAKPPPPHTHTHTHHHHHHHPSPRVKEPPPSRSPLHPVRTALLPCLPRAPIPTLPAQGPHPPASNTARLQLQSSTGVGYVCPFLL